MQYSCSSKFTLACFAFIGILHFPRVGFAEDQDTPAGRSPLNLWVSPGLGIDTIGAGTPFTHLITEIGGRSGKHLVVVKMQAAGDPSFARRILNENGTNDVSILYGKPVYSWETFSVIEVSALAGPSYVRAFDAGTWGKETLGVAGVLSATWTPLRKVPVLGFGLDLYGNLNMVRSWAALGAKVQLGWLY